MSKLAIGLIETVGLTPAIEAADTAVKSANVHLVGYEFTKGGGMTVVKVEGDVGAVKAAISAAEVAASKVGKVFSTKVIPRPSEGISMIIESDETVGLEKEDSEEDDSAENEEDDTKELIEINKQENEIIEENLEKIVQEDEEIETELEEVIDGIEEEYTCNVCKDPSCPRIKGDLRSKCIHYKNE